MALLGFNLKPFIKMDLQLEAIDALVWRDLGRGVSIARLAKEGEASLVFYRIRADAPHDAFSRHEHPQGEIYLILQGAIEDEFGVHGEGEIVHLSAGSVHTPKGVGETVVLVLWPGGVRVVEPTSA